MNQGTPKTRKRGMGFISALTLIFHCAETDRVYILALDVGIKPRVGFNFPYCCGFRRHPGGRENRQGQMVTERNA